MEVCITLRRSELDCFWGTSSVLVSPFTSLDSKRWSSMLKHLKSWTMKTACVMPNMSNRRHRSTVVNNCGIQGKSKTDAFNVTITSHILSRTICSEFIFKSLFTAVDNGWQTLYFRKSYLFRIAWWLTLMTLKSAPASKFFNSPQLWNQILFHFKASGYFVRLLNNVESSIRKLVESFWNR